jgi:hypothetical protein
MIELEDKLGDVLENIGISYSGFSESDGFLVSALEINPFPFMEVYKKLSTSFYGDKISIAQDKILLYVPNIWVKGQRYKVRAFVHFVCLNALLTKVYISPSVFCYTDYKGVPHNFVSHIDLVETMQDDSRMRVIDSLGVLE